MAKRKAPTDGDTNTTLGDETGQNEAFNPNDPNSGPGPDDDLDPQYEKGVQHEAQNGNDEVEDPQEERKVEIVHNQTVVNGHVLIEGAVIKMRNFDIEQHRRAGVPLIDVADEDDREVIDVSEPFVAKEGA